jgi:hypothetical protein
MKTTGINELRTMVEQAVTDATDAQKLTEAIVRATELAEEESKPVTKDHFDARFQTFSDRFDAEMRLVREHFESELRVLRAEMDRRFSQVGAQIADLRSDVQRDFREQTWKVTGSFILVVLAATVLQHYWK